MEKIISEFAKKFNEFSNSSAKNDFESSLKTFLKRFITIFSLLMGTIGFNLVRLISWVPLKNHFNA